VIVPACWFTETELLYGVGLRYETDKFVVVLSWICYCCLVCRCRWKYWTCLWSRWILVLIWDAFLLHSQPECGPVPSVITALPNIGGALCSSCKVWLTPTTRMPAVSLPRRETRWNLLGCPKQPNRPQPLVGWSSPYCEDTRRRYYCLACFFLIVDTCLSCKDIAQQNCAMVHIWRILGDFLCPVFQRAACSTFQTCVLNWH